MLALQGAFAVHIEAFESLGARAVAVRRPGHLEGVDGLVVPGGESTTMSMLAVTSGLLDALGVRLDDGMPALGTCAGAILLARRILDGRADQRCLAAIDVVVRRNGYGSQLDSFETDLDVESLESPFHAVFIRAPVIEETGPDVTVLARCDDRPVVVENGTVTLTTFHPELSGDLRLHRRFLDRLGSS